MAGDGKKSEREGDLKLRIVSWNCQGAFRQKIAPVLTLEPDVLVVQECEPLDKLHFPEGKCPAFAWRTKSDCRKGLAVFGFGVHMNPLDEAERDFQHVVPFLVTTKTEAFTLFAVWALNNKQKREERHIGQVWKGLLHYESILEEREAMLIGDFNSNKQWDWKPRIANHTKVVQSLRERGIESLYHQKTGILHGEERSFTFFHGRNPRRPYHIDYCFASRALRQRSSFCIENPEVFLHHSDHIPIVAELQGDYQSNCHTLKSDMVSLPSPE
jgi:exonuclease III